MSIRWLRVPCCACSGAHLSFCFAPFAILPGPPVMCSQPGWRDHEPGGRISLCSFIRFRCPLHPLHIFCMVTKSVGYRLPPSSSPVVGCNRKGPQTTQRSKFRCGVAVVHESATKKKKTCTPESFF
uniref:Secreted protein n=1 Tax=Rhipicephalus zambeziensis TaxID=60191 RepID=A0A224Y7C4_9ACAR